MLDHVGIHTNQLPLMKGFYENALAPLGYEKIYEHEDGAGFGQNGEISLWIVSTGATGRGINIALQSEDRVGVVRFYNAAMAEGATSSGGPALRPQFHPDFFAAFVIDPDGNNLSAICRSPE
ncbi:VOC family protein [Rhizobium laguerreae]|uniref:VOC family protein n=1 Tax=Rhizobium laguerreae TaxID=1076926 RepID=UPI001C90CC43|nr:VOC family protein [Rhizobium laguerreae]MBY3417070.1 VOC family protein [Rhizobium laguerreae]